ncbi:hypothetical protein CY34DRAFT_19363 [Suillus luteus UH-Slu-Lm8-n1]|uniref:Uncharacterized protein n=1 Tax=Suillus luteus UH-Slu-Lm8-n1 TaxID=930992 RepID=A0A0C9Z3S5_9AGAM|nr:hypothetical protein CY34DRAFT_19363 [Suillus luteus UH-Slu-Lm8-n1]
MSAAYIQLPQDDPRDTCSSHGDDASGDTEPPVEQDAHAGVKKVEAAQRVYGPFSRRMDGK